MKKKTAYLISIIFSILLCGVCRADLIYMETFTNPDSSARSLGQYGWRGNHGSSAAVYDTNSTVNTEVPVIAAVDYLYVNDGVVPGDQAAILWTDVQSFGSIANLTNITFGVSAYNTAQLVQVAVRVGNDWFVTENAYSPAVSDTFVSFSTDVSSVAWKSLNFTSEVILSSPGDVTALPSSGTVTAVGLYIPDQLARFRLDNIKVSGVIPEPRSVSLVVVSSICIFMRRIRIAF